MDEDLRKLFDEKCEGLTREFAERLRGTPICSFIISYLGDVSPEEKGCTVIHAFEPVIKDRLKTIQDSINLNSPIQDCSELANFYFDSLKQIKITQDSLVSLFKALTLASRELGEKVGVNKARIIPIKQDTTYKLFTLRSMYELSYDDDFIFSLTKLNPDGSKGQVKKYFFMGCIQDDGEIFGYESMPLISTGDRILFSSLQDKTLPEYVTSTVVDVIEEGSQN